MAFMVKAAHLDTVSVAYGFRLCLKAFSKSVLIEVCQIPLNPTVEFINVPNSFGYLFLKKNMLIF